MVTLKLERKDEKGTKPPMEISPILWTSQKKSGVFDSIRGVAQPGSALGSGPTLLVITSKEG